MTGPTDLPTHGCPGCDRPVLAAYLACRDCWRRVPVVLAEPFSRLSRMSKERRALMGEISRWLRAHRIPPADQLPTPPTCQHCGAVVSPCDCGANHGQRHWVDRRESRHCPTPADRLHQPAPVPSGSVAR